MPLRMSAAASSSELDERIGVEGAHVVAFVVAVGHAEDRAARGARGLRVVQRIADHQHVARRDAEVLGTRAGAARDRGFFCGSVSPATTCLKYARDPTVSSSGSVKRADLLVTHASGNACVAQPVEPLLHARIDRRVPAVDLGVAALVDRQRALDERPAAPRRRCSPSSVRSTRFAMPLPTKVRISARRRARGRPSSASIMFAPRRDRGSCRAACRRDRS